MDELMQSHARTCFVCHESMPDLRKASAVGVGGGLDVVGHDKCIKALQATYDEYEASQDDEIAGDWNGRVAQVGGSLQQGTFGNGGERGVGVSHTVSKPCVVCKQDVGAEATTVSLSGTVFPCHAACKSVVLKVVSEAMGNLADNRINAQNAVGPVFGAERNDATAKAQTFVEGWRRDVDGSWVRKAIPVMSKSFGPREGD